MADEENDEFEFDISCLSQGYQLSSNQVEKLENSLKNLPWAVNNRLRLIGYYSLKNHAKHADHLSWMVDNYASRRVWRYQISMRLSQEYSLDLRKRLMSCWLNQLNSENNDPNIYGNAGLFLFNYESGLANSFLLQASQLKPDEEFWLDRGCLLNFLEAAYGDKKFRREFAFRALEMGRKFLQLFGTEGGRLLAGSRLLTLEQMGFCALWVDDILEADSLAQKLEEVKNLSGYNSRQCDLFFAYRALLQEDLSESSKYFLQLFRISNITNLDLELSDKLISMGQLSVVLTFLEGCKKYDFWHDTNFESWRKSSSIPAIQQY